MDAEARTWILMLAVPLGLPFLWAYALLPWWGVPGTPFLVAALAAGLAGIATAPWRLWVKLAAAAVYAPAAIFLMAVLSLSAICSAGGDCL